MRKQNHVLYGRAKVSVYQRNMKPMACRSGAGSTFVSFAALKRKHAHLLASITQRIREKDADHGAHESALPDELQVREPNPFEQCADDAKTRQLPGANLESPQKRFSKKSKSGFELARHEAYVWRAKSPLPSCPLTPTAANYANYGKFGPEAEYLAALRAWAEE